MNHNLYLSIYAQPDFNNSFFLRSTNYAANSCKLFSTRLCETFDSQITPKKCGHLVDIESTHNAICVYDDSRFVLCQMYKHYTRHASMRKEC